MNVSRRSLLVGGTAAAVAGAIWIKPSDKGGSYPPYFQRLNEELKASNIDKPSLIIDLDRLDRNIDLVMTSMTKGSHKHYRVVTKSIPSPDLVRYVMKKANTERQMVFHRPFLQHMSQATPQSDILLGKPFPINAAKTFYQQHSGVFDPASQLQWLIDTQARLQQYLALAKTLNISMGINLEIDVGLHRGGFENDAQLRPALQIIADNPAHLRFTGYMGYDAHLSGIPSFLVKGELPKVKQRYQKAVDLLKTEFAQLAHNNLCFNGAGSPTFRYYEGKEAVNDLAAGTCLVKPTHCDLPILDDFQAAAFIATPVLKVQQGAKLPAMNWTGPLIRSWDNNQQKVFFAYSGNWMADNESPPGLSPHFAYVSSNQQGYSGSSSVELGVDDFIFLRPQQSEAVLLQFGDLLPMRDGIIVDRWPVLRDHYAPTPQSI